MQSSFYHGFCVLFKSKLCLMVNAKCTHSAILDTRWLIGAARIQVCTRSKFEFVIDCRPAYFDLIWLMNVAEQTWKQNRKTNGKITTNQKNPKPIWKLNLDREKNEHNRLRFFAFLHIERQRRADKINNQTIAINRGWSIVKTIFRICIEQIGNK